MNKKKIFSSKIDYRLIELADHQLIKDFNCGNESIERYLKQSAYFDTIDFVSSTSLVILVGEDNREELIGFFTLKETPLKTVIPDGLNVIKHKNTLEIARIAVDKKYQKNGFGKIIVGIIKTLAHTTNQRFLTLDALFEELDWYLAQGFQPFIEEETKKSNKDGLVYMYFDLYDLAIVEAYLEDDEQIG